MDRATKELLEAHQAIIDAWFANWLKQQKARSDALWAKRRLEQQLRSSP